MKNYKLSVIVTFCNQSKFIQQAIDNILAQEVNFTYEILIGVDGDKDQDTLSILAKYTEKHKFIKVMMFDSSNELIGLSRASRNRYALAKRASGQYITFLDGDDFYISNELFQKAVRFLDYNFEYIGYAHAHQIYNDKTKEFGQIIRPFQVSSTFKSKDQLVNRKYLFSNDCVFRNYFDFHNLDYVDKYYLNDTTLVLWYLQYGDIFFNPEPMLAYRTNIDSIYTGKPWVEKRLSELIVLEENCRLFPKYKNIFKDRVKKQVANIINRDIKCSKLPTCYYKHCARRKLKISSYVLRYIGNQGIFENILIRTKLLFL